MSCTEDDVLFDLGLCFSVECCQSHEVCSAGPNCDVAETEHEQSTELKLREINAGFLIKPCSSLESPGDESCRQRVVGLKTPWSRSRSTLCLDQIVGRFWLGVAGKAHVSLIKSTMALFHFCVPVSRNNEPACTTRGPETYASKWNATTINVTYYTCAFPGGP